MYQQHPPYWIEVEPTFGCPLSCSFCGNAGIVFPQKYTYMSPEIAADLAAQMAALHWNNTIHFSGRGEPTAHPRIWHIIATFRKAFDQAGTRNYLLMSTSGYHLVGGSPLAVRATVMSFFAAGLDAISLDEYQGIKWANTVREAFAGGPTTEDFAVYEYPADRAGNPLTRNIKQKRLCIVAPINLTEEGLRSMKHLTNRCGAAGPLNYSMKFKRCARPFRQMSIRHDGRAVICCHDWRGVFKAGSAVGGQSRLLNVWHGEALQAARRKLLHGQRDFPPCLGCNAFSFRPGLLPDPMGKETLPEPDAACEAVLKRVTSGRSYTEPVLREWEIKKK